MLEMEPEGRGAQTWAVDTAHRHRSHLPHGTSHKEYKHVFRKPRGNGEAGLRMESTRSA